jgi:hypothetical protein
MKICSAFRVSKKKKQEDDCVAILASRCLESETRSQIIYWIILVKLTTVGA